MKLLQLMCSAMAAIALTVITANQSDGALTYSISVVGPNTVNLNVPFMLDIVLTETATAGEATLLGDPNIGVFQGNFRVGRTGAGNINITGVTGSASFDSFISSSFTADGAELAQQDLDLAATPTGVFVAPATFQILLGRVSLNAISPGSNTFTMADFDPAGDDLVLGDGTILDSVVTYNGLTIAAVPEPSSVVLLSLAGMLIVAVKVRWKFQAFRAQA
ncbi:MAG: PEP-CTERM sorting domain-containing protein [Pirellulaceae bacterium]|nr:PEP-CTERM sorting domain-containing protein [Pirellulaceae bacterium]